VPGNSPAIAVTKASCVSDLHTRTGWAKHSLHWRATMSNRRTSAGALESKGSAHQTRFCVRSRTTYRVSWPFSGCHPSIVSTRDARSR